MNANQGLAKRAVVLMFGGTMFVAILAMLATTVMDAESGETAKAESPKDASEQAGITSAKNNASLDSPSKQDVKPNSSTTKNATGLVLEEGLAVDSSSNSNNQDTTKSSSKQATAAPAANTVAAEGDSKRQPASGKATKTDTKSATPANTKAPERSLDFQTKKALDGVGGELAKVLRKKGGLTLKNTTLKEALFLISQQWRINIVVGSDVDGNVDATFEQTPLFEILENLLTINGYGYRISGQTLTVASLNNIPEMNPLFETALIELKAARPSEVFEIVKNRLSVRGEIKELASSQSLLVNDFPERIEQIRELAIRFDESVATRKAAAEKLAAEKAAAEKAIADKATANIQSKANPSTTPDSTNTHAVTSTPGKTVQKPEEMKVLQLQLKNVKLAQVSQAVDALRSRDGKVTPITAENKLIIVDYPEKLAAIEKMVKDMDDNASVPVRKQFELKYKKIAAVLESVRGLMSPEGKLTQFDSENKLMIVDHKRNLDDIEKLLADIDTAGAALTVAQFSPKHIKVGSLAESLQTMVSRDGKFSMVEVENTLIVIDYPSVIERVKELLEKLDREERGTKVAQFQLQFIRPSSVEPTVRSMLTKDGRLTVNDVANQLTIEDYPYVIAKIESLMKQSDIDGTQPQLLRFKPQFVDAALLKDTVTNLLSRDGKVTTIEGENQVLVLDYPYNLERVRKAMQEMDVMRPQVRITVLIYDMSIDDALNLGLNFQAANKARYTNGVPGSQLKIDSIQSAVPTISSGAASTTPAGVITLLNLASSFDFGAVVNALSTAKNSRLLADPSLTVVDRKKGSISVVQKIPIQQLTQTGGSGTSGAIGTTTFQDAGIKMEVTPRISEDHTIEMTVKPEFSRLTGFTPGPPAQPIIESRVAETTVWVADRQTFVIGGLRQRNQVREERGFPGLKDIKMFHLNRLFSYEENKFFESELVVFINPEIVTPCYGGRDREVGISEYGWSELDKVPPPNNGECQMEFENGDPSKVKIYEDEPKEAIPAPSAQRQGYGKQAGAQPRSDKSSTEKKPADKVAKEDRFDGGHGERWGRKDSERGFIPTPEASFRGDTKPKNQEPVAPKNVAKTTPSVGPAPVSVAPNQNRPYVSNAKPNNFAQQPVQQPGAVRIEPVSQPTYGNGNSGQTDNSNSEMTSSRRRVTRASNEKAATAPVPVSSPRTMPPTISQLPSQPAGGSSAVAASQPERIRYAMTPMKTRVREADVETNAAETSTANAERATLLATPRSDLNVRIR